MAALPYERLCSREVTLYHRERRGDGYVYASWVLRAYLDEERGWQDTGRGGAAGSAFLLLVPHRAGDLRYVPAGEYAQMDERCGCFTLAFGDKVRPGVWGAIEDEAAWERAVPRFAPGLCVVGRIAHRQGLLGGGHVEAREA